jgi:hypothetical protein
MVTGTYLETLQRDVAEDSAFQCSQRLGPGLLPLARSQYATRTGQQGINKLPWGIFQGDMRDIAYFRYVDNEMTQILLTRLGAIIRKPNWLHRYENT